MKAILSISILLCAIATPVFCQTSQNSVETDIIVIKTEIRNLKEYINHGFNNIQKDFDNVRMNLDDIQKDFDGQNDIIIACIGIPLAILAIAATVWGLLAHRRSTKDRTLEKQIEILTQERETLKQQRIVNT